MKVLIVASYNTNRYSPFVTEQVNSLIQGGGIEADYFGIQGKGFIGYILCRKRLVKKIKEYKPNLIHAHYGLSGLLANLQRRIPVITTFHGSDIHSRGYLLMLSKLCMKLSRYNIFVNNELYRISKYKRKNYAIQPCGVDLKIFHSIEKKEARKILGWSEHIKYVLFAGAFDNTIKNYPLAQKSVFLQKYCKLIELKGYNREEVNLLINACDCLLMTSHREASPMVIKEAMICGCPIVSVDVGDVKEIVTGVEGCYIVKRNENDIADKLNQVFSFNERHNGCEKIIQLGLENIIVAKKVENIYNKILRT